MAAFAETGTVSCTTAIYSDNTPTDVTMSTSGDEVFLLRLQAIADKAERARRALVHQPPPWAAGPQVTLREAQPSAPREPGKPAGPRTREGGIGTRNFKRVA